MARKHNEDIAVICPVDGYATRGYDQMPCPDCGTPMVPDMEMEDHDKLYAGIHMGESDLGRLGTEDLEGETAFGEPPHQSLESMAEEEHSQDERYDSEF
jgi:hypothetical protein